MNDLDKPAVPVQIENQTSKLMEVGIYFGGLSKREYAAIHLRVPNSGNEELDTMIRQAQRMELAKAAMQAHVTKEIPIQGDMFDATISQWSFEMADAMLKEGEK